MATPTTGFVIEKIRKIKSSSTGSGLLTSSLPAASAKTTVPCRAVPCQHRHDAGHLAVFDQSLHTHVEPLKPLCGNADLSRVDRRKVSDEFALGGGRFEVEDCRSDSQSKQGDDNRTESPGFQMRSHDFVSMTGSRRLLDRSSSNFHGRTN